VLKPMGVDIQLGMETEIFKADLGLYLRVMCWVSGYPDFVK